MKEKRLGCGLYIGLEGSIARRLGDERVPMCS
jgi:hypothetical protein